MNREVIICCAVTGAADNASRHPDLPITPKQIATAAIEAAKAGAAIAHCDVRDPETGQGSRDPELHKEVVDRIRPAEPDAVINLTGEMGGGLCRGPGEGSLVYVSTPDMLRAGTKRIQELGVKPELEIFADQAGDRTIEELELLRDDCLIDIMRALSKYQTDAGTLLKERS